MTDNDKYSVVTEQGYAIGFGFGLTEVSEEDSEKINKNVDKEDK